ncbi:hypothetical protein Bbelb_242200 [Branchiostoma belcheri]|nr:hypothetical protein Bbelb_242200 [Branchiostoma belcheri]
MRAYTGYSKHQRVQSVPGFTAYPVQSRGELSMANDTSFVPARGGLRGQHAKPSPNTVPLGPRIPSRQTSTANPTAGNQVSTSLHVVNPTVLTTLQQGTLKHLKLPWKQVGKNIRKAWDTLMS